MVELRPVLRMAFRVTRMSDGEMKRSGLRGACEVERLPSNSKALDSGSEAPVRVSPPLVANEVMLPVLIVAIAWVLGVNSIPAPLSEYSQSSP